MRLYEFSEIVIVDPSKLFILYSDRPIMSINFAKKENQFGSTYELHSALMAVIWGPGINLAIVLVLYSYRKYYVYAHSIYGLFITIFTISTSLPILLYTGILSTPQTEGELKVSGSAIYAHYIVGISSMSAVLLLALLGITTKLLNFLQFSSISLIVIKNVHRILGYLIAILAKSNVYIIYGPSDGSFWLFFTQDFLFAAIIIARKIIFPKMQHVVSPQKHRKQRTFKSLSEVGTGDYCIFANYIYSLEPVKKDHPAGYQIIESVKNRDVDRFIYGMYGSEAHPEIWSHSHSFRSLELLGDPVGRLSIQSNYYGFEDSPSTAVRIQHLAKSGSIYEIQLQKEGDRIVLRDYESLSQLGRFYSLTVNKVTRLYTSVNFLSSKNKQLMRHLLHNQLPNEETIYTKEDYQPPSLDNNKFVEYIPLLIKKYAGGKLTKHLIQNPNQEVRISVEKGEGLQLESLSSHRLMIIAGGTGLFPFYDFIDLLFKWYYLKSNQEEKDRILKVSPILQRYSLQDFDLDVYLGVNSIEDIHPIILCQLTFLLKHSKNFRLTLRTKETSNALIDKMQVGDNLKVTTGKFEDLLQEELSTKEFSRIYVCGPPRMNEAMSKYFKERQLDPGLYHFL